MPHALPAAIESRISSTNPHRVGLASFPLQTYKGSLTLPNPGLFFNLGLLGGWGGFWFENIGFNGLCAA
jgi:hypothetical protein